MRHVATDEGAHGVQRVADETADTVEDTGGDIPHDAQTPTQGLARQPAEETRQSAQQARHGGQRPAWQREKPAHDTVNHIGDNGVSYQGGSQVLEKANHARDQPRHKARDGTPGGLEYALDEQPRAAEYIHDSGPDGRQIAFQFAKMPGQQVHQKLHNARYYLHNAGE